ncbi:MAG: DUF975 family protein [Clostridiales bacterium]|nr:DUF975 family protein [Clostridiales bacterium]
MWNRKNVKQKGKKSFFGNYWKCVLVALILALVIGTAGASGSSVGTSIGSAAGMMQTYEDETSTGYSSSDDLSETDFDIEIDPGNGVTTHISQDDAEFTGVFAGALIGIAILFFIVMLIATAFSLAIRYFLMAPFEYGCRKFFRKNLDEPAKLSNIVYVFDSKNYKNVVKTAFLRDLFIFLWSLLFIIPGIIKSYEYRLVPYIVSEDPTINFRSALDQSKELMKGNKWRTFVLDLSFIGWDLLSALSFGLAGIFFVEPYKAATDAALYESIKYGINAA